MATDPNTSIYQTSRDAILGQLSLLDYDARKLAAYNAVEDALKGERVALATMRAADCDDTTAWEPAVAEYGRKHAAYIGAKAARVINASATHTDARLKYAAAVLQRCDYADALRWAHVDWA